MAATGNSAPRRIEAVGHHMRLTYDVAAASVTDFTIQTPFVGQPATVIATPDLVALTAGERFDISTGIVYITGITSDAAEIVTVVIEN